MAIMRFSAKSLRSKSVSPINRTNERNILLLPSRNPWKVYTNHKTTTILQKTRYTEKHVTIVVVVFFSMSNDLDLTHPFFLKTKRNITTERIRSLDINLQTDETGFSGGEIFSFSFSFQKDRVFHPPRGKIKRSPSPFF